MGILDNVRKQSDRDLVEIGKRAAEQRRAGYESKFKGDFEAIFGFRPELGNVETVDVRNIGVKRCYWVQGFLFSIDGTRNGTTQLLVVDTTDMGRAFFVDNAYEFHRHVVDGKIKRVDHAGDSDG